MYRMDERLFIWLLGFVLLGTEALQEHGLTVILRNGSSYNSLYLSPRFPDVSKVFGVHHEEVTSLSLTFSKLEKLDGNLSRMFNLKSLALYGNKLREIPVNIFRNNSNLIELNLHDNNIENLKPGAFNGLFENDEFVGVLFMNRNRLRKFPAFLHHAPGLKEMHLDGNPIVGISQAELKNVDHLHKLFLRQASLLKIADFTFKNNKDLVEIDLSGNKELKIVASAAFEGAKQLKSLNLSFTGIKTVPSKGLKHLEVLSFRGSDDVWTIEDEIVQLPKLRFVEVPTSRRFLCCAFIYERKKIGEAASGRGSNRTRNCTSISPVTTPATRIRSVQLSTSRTPGKPSSTESPGGFWLSRRRAKRKLLWYPERGGFLEQNLSLATARSKLSYSNNDDIDDFGKGGFLTATVPVHSVIFHCGNTSGVLHKYQLTPVTCVPGPDELRPCDDIMGNTFLSATSWIISLLALMSNAVVFSVLVLSRRHFTVTKFLITNLSFADMCLGLYLFMMICASTHTHGSYYNYIRGWQFGAGCKVAGFLAIFSSQLSMLVLTVITIERYLAIVYAVYLNKRLHIRNARILCIGSWVASAFIALLPLVGVNSYSQVALCLPFQTGTVLDMTYIAFMLTFNTVLCSVVFLAYFRMYWVVRSPQTDSTAQSRNDSAIAKRMALLVFTDFACWAPIAIIGLFSAAGYTNYIGMDVKKSKYLLVIFFPINSICNPFLYALSTRSFRRELVLLLASCGLCKAKAHEYTVGGSFSRRSKQNRDMRNSDTQSTFVSRKDSRMDSLKSFFRRTVLLKGLQNSGQCSPKAQSGNIYPLTRYNDSDGMSVQRNFSPMSESAMNGPRDGSLPEFSNHNSHRSSANSNAVSLDFRGYSLTPSGNMTAKSPSYTRSESAISSASDGGVFSDQAFLIRHKSKESALTDQRRTVPKDYRF